MPAGHSPRAGTTAAGLDRRQRRQDRPLDNAEAETHATATAQNESAESAAEGFATLGESGVAAKFRKKRAAHKPVHAPKPGEVVVGRRLYRSGQSEYLINGR